MACEVGTCHGQQQPCRQTGQPHAPGPPPATLSRTPSWVSSLCAALDVSTCSVGGQSRVVCSGQGWQACPAARVGLRGGAPGDGPGAHRAHPQHQVGRLAVVSAPVPAVLIVFIVVAAVRPAGRGKGRRQARSSGGSGSGGSGQLARRRWCGGSLPCPAAHTVNVALITQRGQQGVRRAHAAANKGAVVLARAAARPDHRLGTHALPHHLFSSFACTHSRAAGRREGGQRRERAASGAALPRLRRACDRGVTESASGAKALLMVCVHCAR